MFQGLGQLFGPKGGLVTGNIGDIASGAQNTAGGFNSFMAPLNTPPPTTSTLNDTLGINKAQFDALDPAIRQELLRKVMGR
jgi:hypothetical protein